jgi:lipoyl(octanoyl) transferase
MPLQQATGNLHAADPLVIRHPGLVDYTQAWRDMQAFTDRRDANTPDELWFLEHPPVFTQGRNGKDEHLHDPGNIPVIQVDRGGQVTYHGPGQLVVYTLLDIRRRQLGVQSLVRQLEQAVIDMLTDHGVTGERRDKAPGVYVEGSKVAALGLRVRRGCSFHGLALNVDMDLSPFTLIDPCGFQGLKVTQLRDLGLDLTVQQAADEFQEHFERLMNSTHT